jgi:hypothetical protein
VKNLVLFVLVYAILCALFMTWMLSVGTTRRNPPMEQAPLCFDPFAKYTGIEFEDCGRVNRYWDA